MNYNDGIKILGAPSEEYMRELRKKTDIDRYMDYIKAVYIVIAAIVAAVGFITSFLLDTSSIATYMVSVVMVGVALGMQTGRIKEKYLKWIIVFRLISLLLPLMTLFNLFTFSIKAFSMDGIIMLMFAGIILVFVWLSTLIVSKLILALIKSQRRRWMRRQR